MRKLKNLLFIVTLFCTMSGCTMYDSKDLASEPGMQVAVEISHSYIIPMIRTAEFADFFHKYQEIRTDRDASEALAESVFGSTWSSLYYEEAQASDFGIIKLTDEAGTYKVETWNSVVYTATVNADGSVDVILGRHDNFGKVTSGRAKVVIESGRLLLNELELLTTEAGTMMKCTSTSDPLSVAVTRNGNICFPDSGKLLFNLSGTVKDRFYLIWSNNGYCEVSR